MRMEATIEVTGRRKRFGPAVALDGMSFMVLPGLVTGFAGPDDAAPVVDGSACRSRSARPSR